MDGNKGGADEALLHIIRKNVGILVVCGHMMLSCFIGGNLKYERARVT